MKAPPTKFEVSRDRRIALGELKNLAGFVMDELDSEIGAQFIAGFALRMQSIIQGEAEIYTATDIDIEDALKTARAVEQQMLDELVRRWEREQT